MAIVLILAVLIPSVVKLTHAFNHHHHMVCVDDLNHSTHFHQLDLDCDFYKFKLSNQFYFESNHKTLQDNEDNFKIIASQYQFVSDYQKLQTALRGPPKTV